jgi:hypothetical protein
MFLNHFKNFYPGVSRDRLIEVAAHFWIVASLGVVRRNQESLLRSRQIASMERRALGRIVALSDKWPSPINELLGSRYLSTGNCEMRNCFLEFTCRDYRPRFEASSSIKLPVFSEKYPT